ncbi:type II secretion system F family protein [Sansalvadorimonas verongulae]|uniref:type II secretion system F family protein n=1 Tax=Sansalvadorimonas verongulae TaxID=2172824 RepID=UPI0012BC4ACC|nr:type II secretion system F family protein [Sansalvadorimonas verongulae]MTI15561.1 pilus assembly protein TadB [Sansalvadorimonas verongulae]
MKSLFVRKSSLQFLTDPLRQKVQVSGTALDIRSLTEQPLQTKIRIGFNNVKETLGKHFYGALALYIAAMGCASYWCHKFLPLIPLALLTPALFLVTGVISILVIKHIQRRQFEEAFPNALRTLTGAVTAGESLHHSIVFTGHSLDNIVGREFKNMGRKLTLGHTMEDVLMASCQRFPYQVFVFFVLALRANTSRGGQLKNIFKNLEQVMNNNQTLQKKMNALTSEVRMSAKIIGALPPSFLLFMKYITPENFHFLLHDSGGHMLLMYVAGSEALGMLIIWYLMRKVRG